MLGHFRCLSTYTTPGTVYQPSLNRYPFEWQCPVDSPVVLSWFVLRLSTSATLLSVGFLRQPLACLYPWMEYNGPKFFWVFMSCSSQAFWWVRRRYCLHLQGGWTVPDGCWTVTKGKNVSFRKDSLRGLVNQLWKMGRGISHIQDGGSMFLQDITSFNYYIIQ